MAKEKSWFKQHKILSGFMAFILLFIGMGILGSTVDEGQDVSNSLDASNKEDISNKLATTINTEKQNQEESKIVENEGIFDKNGLMECDFSDFDKPIEDLILTRDDIQKKYSEKNSWGEYEISDETIFPKISDSQPEHHYYSELGERRKVNINMLVNGGPLYIITEYKDSQSAQENFKAILDKSKTNKNIRKETGNYGEERIEYAKDYLRDEYKIYFRIGNKIIDISSWDPYNNIDADIEFARLIHNKAC